MASAQAKAGLEVRILSTDHWYEGHTEIPNCEVRVFPAPIGFWQWSPSLKRALVDEVGWADVVNVHTLWSYATLAASRSCAAANVPYVLRPCGMLDTWSLSQKSWKKKVYASLVESGTINRAGALWFSSEEERSSSKGFNYQTSDFVIPLGVTLTEYLELPEKGEFRRQFLDACSKRILLFLGRITPVKQLDLLIRAYADIANNFPDVVLVIAGPDEGGLSDQLKILAESLGIRERVIFPGGLQKNEVVAALTDAEVFVLPSLHENFGVAAIEAMAAGVPVIVTDRVGLAGFVSSANAGIVVSSNQESLAIGITQLLNNPSEAKQMGERGRQIALDKFTWDKIVPRITEAYQTVITRGENGHRRV
ncbi:MAG: hypothetical protein JWM21_1370 [Acidobacteria bacterium]|nr:hypothetical protein [Acidobacteriota bacterium]